MVIRPDVHALAQAEISTVLNGPERLPDFADRAHTPYLEAVISEVLRWNPVTPLGRILLLLSSDAQELIAFNLGCCFWCRCAAFGDGG
jgi:hypothetical protein